MFCGCDWSERWTLGHQKDGGPEAAFATFIFPPTRLLPTTLLAIASLSGPFRDPMHKGSVRTPCLDDPLPRFNTHEKRLIVQHDKR